MQYKKMQDISYHPVSLCYLEFLCLHLSSAWKRTWKKNQPMMLAVGVALGGVPEESLTRRLWSTLVNEGIWNPILKKARSSMQQFRSIAHFSVKLKNIFSKVLYSENFFQRAMSSCILLKIWRFICTSCLIDSQKFRFADVVWRVATVWMWQCLHSCTAWVSVPGSGARNHPLWPPAPSAE